MSKTAIEQRRFRRFAIQDSFSLFIVIPKSQGMSRIYLRDLSQAGLCFRIEAESEFSKGQELELRLYTSPAFFVSLKSKVVRVMNGEVGVEFSDLQSKAVKAIAKLQEFIELASEASQS